ncbi:DUF2249 domain-containing protein [Dechloromonas sp.]|uniref:DUF2249 domain-containing protein n=1 Tax=Dechloromonas sp. TaxID=1917218 RepID=UPI00263F819E|nr:DUF2249 domain-containing protein [Dechloromonas sp.]
MQAIHVCNHTTPEALYPFDARGIAKRFRHAAIFGALDALQPGETMRFCNDHNPLPLLAQLLCMPVNLSNLPSVMSMHSIARERC